MNDPGQRRLWSIPGDGVLARQGNLVLLVSIDDGEFAESLLDLLTRVNAAGGDGRALADAISTEVERHQSWGESHSGPAVVAFGPAGSGLAFLVSGTASADISTPHGMQHFAAGHPSMLLKSVVGVPVQSVRAGLGGDGHSDRTDRFSRLDSGTVRASGLSYLSDQAGAPAAPSRSGEPGRRPSAPAAGAQAPASPFPNPSPPAEPRTPPPGPPAHAGPPERPLAGEPTFRRSADPSFRPEPSSPVDPPAKSGRPAAGPFADEFTPPPGEFTPPPREFTPPQGEFTTSPREFTRPPVKSPYPQPAESPYQPPRAESPYQQAPPATSSPFAAEPERRAPAEHGFAEPASGRANPAESGAGHAALYDLGLEEPGVTGPAPAPDTSLSDAIRPAPEPPPAPGHAAAETDEDGGSPIVLGIHCKNGHFTDPDARSCVVCGTGISGIGGIKRRSAGQQLAPRPPLGVLILDDGATLSVDGDFVIGRDPARDPSVSAGEARMLRVVDAEQTVSRVHARVHLAGWQVLLTDLGSANGTRVQQPGSKTEQVLEPRVPVVVEHGARIFVGTPCLRFERSGG